MCIRDSYYVSCFARNLSLRLFADFEADCCLVITNPERFGVRFIDAVKGRLPKWGILPTFVEYIDPLNPSNSWDKIYETKHFRYAYQREFRFAIVPPTPQTVLDPFFLELGNLSDCCQLLEP